MRKFRVVTVLAIAILSFIAGAYFYKIFIYEDICYDAGGIINAEGFCIGWRE